MSRPLALEERLSVTRRNCGFPHAITVLVSYASHVSQPSHSFLSTRVGELQEHFPLLCARICDTKTRAPYFEPWEHAWAASNIVRKSAFEPLADTRAEMEAILCAEIERTEQQDLETAPTWRVSVLSAPGATRAYVAVSANHAITDGMGALALACAVLAPSVTDLPHEVLAQIPRIEDTVPLRPGLGQLLTIAWRELLVPLLPTRLQPYLAPQPPWPARGIAKPVLECSSGLSLLMLPPELVTALKAAGTRHGVPALHMTLKIAYTLAIWRVCCGARRGEALEVATPRSERQSALGHAHCTGNYISTFYAQLRVDPAADFWTTAAAMSAHLRSPAGLARARGEMGMLAYIPDPSPDPAMRDTSTPTGWESFFMDKARGPLPHDWALAMSNLGRVGLPPGATDLVWTQSASPFGPVFGANVVGHDAGLRVTTIWLEGAVAGREEVEEMERVFERVLSRLCDDTRASSSFEELVAA